MIEHPIYTPDLVVYDIWLYFHLKNVRGVRFHSKDEIDETAKIHFLSVPRNDRLEVFNL